MNADATDSVTVGGSGRTKVSYRFRAASSGPLSAIRAYFTNKQGTGGGVQVTVRPDDGTSAHLPSATVLATAYLYGPTDNGNFPLVSFSSPASLTAGQLYHLVFINSNATPETNNAALASLLTNGSPSQAQTIVPDTDWAELAATGTTGWAQRKGATPILELDYAGGAVQGQGFVEVWSTNPKSIGGSYRVAEKFTVSGSSRTTNNVALRLKRVTGSGALTARLEKADGTLVTSGSVAYSAIGTSTQWVTVPFAATATLAAGTTYRLVLTAPSGTTYSTFPLREGGAYGYKAPALFPDGFAEFTTGSGWLGWDMWGTTNRADGDLQFKFGYGSGSGGTTPTPAPSLPSIASLSASPASIVSGSSSTLSWSVTGATGLSLSGVGDVTGKTSVSVKPTATTTYTLTATSAAGSVTKSATVTVASATPVPAPAPSGTAAFYGNAWNADGLGNTNIGGPTSHHPSYRFKADHTGYLKAVRIFLVWDYSKSGYHGGTGGKVRVAFRKDDGTSSHLPGAEVTSYTISSPLSGSKYPLVTLPTPMAVTAGQYYHVSFTNTDSSPSTNYVSVNGLHMVTPLAQHQPMYANTDWTQLDHDSYTSSWYASTHITPVMELDYSDGYATGNGYMEVWSAAPQKISGSYAVREQFTVSGKDRKVDAAYVRLKRVSGSSSLNIRLEDSSGNLVDQGYVAASGVSTSNQWVKVTFSGVRTLSVGKTYNLVLRTTSDTSYQAYPVRDGSIYYGWAPASVFHDGSAQYTTGSSWTGWSIWGQGGRPDGDLQFYFHVAQ